MKVIRTERITTGQRLKQLVSERDISNKEFIRQLKTWLKEKQAAGEYREEPEISEKDFSRWTREDKPVQMRINKIRMFADFFGVDPEYLQCKQVSRNKPDFSEFDNQIDLKVLQKPVEEAEKAMSWIEKERSWIELLRILGYSVDLVPAEIETDDCFQFIDGDLLVTAIESYPIDFEPHITDPSGNIYIFDSSRFFEEIEKYIKFQISQMQPVDNNSHKG